MIKSGDTFPTVDIFYPGENGPEPLNTGNEIENKKLVIFGVPGAFTPTCNNTHLPGFIEHAKAMREKGVDDIICVSVNDPFVMRAWGEAVGVSDHVTLWSDGNGTLAESLGLVMDGSIAGLGSRMRRFAMIVENGVVQHIGVEDGPGSTEQSGADVILQHL